MCLCWCGGSRGCQVTGINPPHLPGWVGHDLLYGEQIAALPWGPSPVLSLLHDPDSSRGPGQSAQLPGEAAAAGWVLLSSSHDQQLLFLLPLSYSSGQQVMQGSREDVCWAADGFQLLASFHPVCLPNGKSGHL